jgi:hypothetical protein
MDTVKAMVPSGFWPRAKDAATRKARQKMITWDLLFISVALFISVPPPNRISVLNDINKFRPVVKRKLWPAAGRPAQAAPPS